MAEMDSHPTPSRYRSQRHKQPGVDSTQKPDEALNFSAEDGIIRSKSRYHRKPEPSQGLPTEPTRPSSKQQSGAIPSRYHSQHRQSPSKQEQLIQAPERKPRSSSNEQHNPLPCTRVLQSRDQRSSSSDGQVLSDLDEAGRQHTNDGLGSNIRNVGSSSSPRQVLPHTSKPSGELFPPPRQLDPPVRHHGPPQSSAIRATKSMGQLQTYDSANDKGCFGGLFKRRRGEASPVAADKAPVGRPKTATEHTHTTKLGGGGVAPGTDVPISAINASDRQVLVECGTSKTLCLVIPTTTSVDIIKCAATCMSERINVKSAILLENFGPVGIQRPLRRYERVRDVMNGWDNDTQNSLILVDPGTGTVEPELTMVGVPKEEPAERSWHFSYSQRAGKWDKRYITLKAGGQVVCQKDIDKAKDIVNICHLSDFDIYTPTPERLKKRIKPPKKICFAIKSQQKASVFESTHDFVHFFSTSDDAEANSFYSTIQGWRSWYLVQVKGEGGQEKPGPVSAYAEQKDQLTSNVQSKPHHRAQESMESHYQLGSFRPLMDMGQFEKQARLPYSENDRPGSSRGFAKSANQFDVNVSPERRTSTARRQHPPMSLNNQVQLGDDEPLANLNRQGSMKGRRHSFDHKRDGSSESREFGSLGRNHSQHRREHAEMGLKRREPSTNGPKLPNGGVMDSGHSGGGAEGLRRNPSARKPGNATGDIRRTSSTRDGGRDGGDSRGASDLTRATSRRQMPKPLIDLTPEYREPPQHLKKKGKGFHPDSVDQAGLIASATTPEDPLKIPNGTVFRNTSGQHSGEAVHLASNNLPLRARAGTVAEHQARHVSGEDGDGFTGEGLLAAPQSRQGWGGNDRGRGVIDGSRAGGKPLVDLTTDSRFVEGSLLNRVEKAQGGPIPPPIVDREKRVERETKVGERY